MKQTKPILGFFVLTGGLMWRLTQESSYFLLACSNISSSTKPIEGSGSSNESIILIEPITFAPGIVSVLEHLIKKRCANDAANITTTWGWCRGWATTSRATLALATSSTVFGCVATIPKLAATEPIWTRCPSGLLPTLLCRCPYHQSQGEDNKSMKLHGLKVLAGSMQRRCVRGGIYSGLWGSCITCMLPRTFFKLGCWIYTIHTLFRRKTDLS